MIDAAYILRNQRIAFSPNIIKFLNIKMVSSTT